MADLNVAEIKEENKTEGPRVVEGNTGTLSVLLLDQINNKLSKIVEFIEEIKKNEAENA